MKNELQIFDLDGTLIDTSVANYKAYCKAAIKYGTKLNFTYDDYIYKYNGKNYKDFFTNIGEHDIELIHEEKKKIYNEFLPECKINKKLFEYIEKIKDEKYIVLATNANKVNTYEVLRYFGKIELFDLILTKEDVEMVKPNPEIFLKAMKYFNIDKEHTTVFEDSEVGIEAAKRANLKTFLVSKFKK